MRADLPPSPPPGDDRPGDATGRNEQDAAARGAPGTKRPRFPESFCGKTEPHEHHAYTYTTGFYVTGYHCPGVDQPPERPPEYVAPEQMKRIHDAWWDFWISESDHQRTVHLFIGIVLLVQSAMLVWLTLRVLGG